MQTTDWPVDWHDIIEKLEIEQKEEVPTVALVIAGESFQLCLKPDVDFLLEAIAASELPPSPPPMEFPEDDDYDPDPPEPMVA